jgi:hypothetical protein
MTGSNVKFAIKQASEKLVGRMIVGTVESSDGESWGLQIKDSTGRLSNVWVDQDPEGNGPGWLAYEA